jgi:hypothetical protein
MRVGLVGVQKGPRELIIHNKTPLERRSFFRVRTPLDTVITRA